MEVFYIIHNPGIQRTTISKNPQLNPLLPLSPGGNQE